MQAKERLGSPRARLFVALELPDLLRSGLAEWQQMLLSAGRGELRATPEESMHVTLVFLGYVEERAIDRVAAIVREADGSAVDFRIRPSAVPVPKRRPRLYAAELADRGSIAQLRSKLVPQLTRSVGYTDEKRPFWPHVTLCRVKSRVSRHVPLVQIPSAPESVLTDHNASTLTLFRSDLTQSAAVYSALESTQLSKRDNRRLADLDTAT